MKRLSFVILGVLVGLAAPVAARSVADFARNAGHVNGFRAIGPRASATERAGKLVATDENGQFPSFIVPAVERANNAMNFRGLPLDAFQFRCSLGSVFGYAEVPGAAPQGRSDVDGFSCFGDISVEHPAPGVYVVDMALQTVKPCEAANTTAPTSIPAVITVKGTRPFLATYQTVCDASRSPVQEVHLYDTTGSPTDADFTIVVPHWVGAPVIP